MAERFSVDVTVEEGVTVLALSGELDHDTAGPLRGALEVALAGDGGHRVLVDCAGLGFCDSTGLNTLLRARLAARESGTRLELAGLRQPVARMFRTTGADGVFLVHEDRAAALGVPPGAGAGSGVGPAGRGGGSGG
ncbi:STAS domain-containing protein [Streptomyces sp. G-G2]|uniref:STAS domain-containing protein n=1 Tax=Streptomyces sp. G-G2 TaxID=3046201 RepID=UPI0024BACFE5|nr:STAS domain-containing protein [Streptomyces sp. G-G2]MDJ0382456.1 STAS domain-containing protein [Streptomyces sp. G-G2]